jgi:hypothetical protein
MKIDVRKYIWTKYNVGMDKTNDYRNNNTPGIMQKNSSKSTNQKPISQPSTDYSV